MSTSKPGRSSANATQKTTIQLFANTKQYIMSNTPNTDMLNTQLNADENQNKEASSIFHREEIPNSPFVIVGEQSQGFYMLMGRYRMTPAMSTPEEVKTYAEKNLWNIILQMALSVYNEMQNNPSLKPDKQ